MKYEVNVTKFLVETGTYTVEADSADEILSKYDLLNLDMTNTYEPGDLTTDDWQIDSIEAMKE